MIRHRLLQVMLIGLMAGMCLFPTWMAIGLWLNGCLILLKLPEVLAVYLIFQAAMSVALVLFARLVWRE